MKKLFLSLAMLLGLVAPVLAQSVNQVPTVGAISQVFRFQTYSAISVGLVPAASATDIMCLNGSTSKNVTLRKVIISGTAGTAIATPFILKLNHSLDTGGTAATGIALPVAAPNNPSNAAATATLTAYTANPTVTDASPNLLLGVTNSIPVTTGVTEADVYTAGTSIDMQNQGWDILKAATVVQQLCINLNGATITTGVLAITFEWTET